MRLFFLLLFCFCPKGESFKNVFEVVLSFLKFDERPCSVVALNLCWDKPKLLALSKALHNINMNIGHYLHDEENSPHLQHTVILVDLSCQGTDRYLIEASEKGHFKSPYRWLFLDFDANSLNILERLYILVDSDVIIARNIDEATVSFIEAYKITESSDVIITTRATWRSSRQPTTEIAKMGLKQTASAYGVIEDHRTTRVLSIRRKNLMKYPLAVANVLYESNETRYHLDDRKMLHHDSITKMTYMVVRTCFEMLNSTEKRLFANTWGYKDKNGSWNGIVELLHKKKADLGTLTIFTQERMKVIDYIAMVGTTAVRFVFREPPLSYVSNIFTLPFTAAVWWAILICVLACSMFLYITSKWEASMSLHPLQLDGSWADVIILMIGAVLQQGCTLEPRFAAGRCVTLLLFVSLTILYAAYSANIVVLLRAPSSTVRTVADLLNSPLKLGASDFEYNRYFFKKLNEPIRKAIYDKKIAPKGKKPNFYSMTEGVEKIRQGLFAFHMELNPGYRLIQETYQEGEKCDLVEIDYINEIDPWVPGQKRSPFKDLFKISFIKIRESGLQSCVHRRLNVPRPRCLGAVSTFSSVGIVDMYPVLLTTMYGMLLAPAVLFLEVMYKRLTILREKRKAMRESFILLE